MNDLILYTKGEIDPMEHNDPKWTPQEADAALAEIEQTLHHMLTMSRLSASDLDVDRAILQKALEQMGRKIDRIADELEKN